MTEPKKALTPRKAQPNKKIRKAVEEHNASAAPDDQAVLPTMEQAKDILEGKRDAYEPVDPSIDLIDRIGKNNPRRMRGGTSTGAKPMIRRVMGTSDINGGYPLFTIQELMALTGKSEINVRTSLADLRSPKFCGQDGVFITIMQKQGGVAFYQYDLDATLALKGRL